MVGKIHNFCSKNFLDREILPKVLFIDRGVTKIKSPILNNSIKFFILFEETSEM